MRRSSNRVLIIAMVVAAAAVLSAQAAVTSDEAAALGTSLTPVGAERAGNVDGSIPTWNGGLTTALAGAVTDKARPDPFENEKPLLSVSAQNVAIHAEKLSDGVKALLAKYPDSYRIDVYPSHRTAAAPESVYRAIARNAVTAKLPALPGGAPVNASGGVPFPIPKTGKEAIWNHVLRWRGGSTQAEWGNYVGTADGKRVLAIGGVSYVQQPYYLDDTSINSISAAEHYWFRVNFDAPASKFGESYVQRDHQDPDDSNFWVYIPGQRRVRQLPPFCCDKPLQASAGVIYFDEYEVFNGRVDRFDWKLVGKKEMYIPYNANRSAQRGVDSLLGAHHLNPEAVRWELHRVWIIEATVAPNHRHTAARGRYYLDEDTWIAVLGDRWDESGQLIRTMWSLPLLMPEIPAVVVGTSGGHNLVSGTWIAMTVMNDKSTTLRAVPRMPESFFTPDSMAGSGVR